MKVASCFLDCARRLALLAGLSLLPAAGAGAATIALLPGSQQVELGATAPVDIAISELGGEIVSAYDLDLRYDASLLRATQLDFTSALGDELFFEVLSSFDLSIAGRVDFAQLSLLDDASLFALQGGDSVVIASIAFETLAPGTSSLDFVFDAFNDVKGREAAILEIASGGGSIQVGSTPSPQVPEPSAALLFGVAWVLTAAWLRRTASGVARR